MINSSQDKVSNSQDMAENLRVLYGKVAEFDACCSFLSDAFACIAEQEEVIDEGTVKGIGLHTGWMKRKSSEIKGELKIIFEQATAGKNEALKD